MMTRDKPVDFNKRFDIVGCFVEHEGKFTLLKRQPHKANGGKWGLPAGKVEEDESIAEALLREIQEETGLIIDKDSLSYFDSLYVRDESFDIQWHMFSTHLNDRTAILLNPNEHSEYAWVTPDESLKMELIHDLPESIKMFYKIEN